MSGTVLPNSSPERTQVDFPCATSSSFGEGFPIHFSNLQALIRKMIITTTMSSTTRRWERMPVDLPVKVFTSKGFSTTVVEGRGTEISQGGMVLYAGILLNPGDLLEVEFGMPTASRMPAIVRSRNGFCFGLEFITPLPS